MRKNQIIIAIGKGDYWKGREVMEEIALRLIHARKKHNWRGYKPIDGYTAIANETFELARAVKFETPERAHDEALDVAATAIRFLLREYKEGR